MSTSAAQISAWGNGLALRLTKPMAKTAGVAEGSPVRVTVKPGRIVIETEDEPTLDQCSRPSIRRSMAARRWLVAR